MSLTTIAAPAIEPLSVAEMKPHLSVDHADDDVLISDTILAVRRAVEARLRQRLITQTVRLTLNAFPTRIEIPVWPVQSISAITYTDSAGTPVVLPASDYRLIVSRKPNEIAPAYLKVWPVTRADYDAVTVDLVVGYGAGGADVPEDIRQAMKLLIADYFDHRGNMVTGAAVSAVPIGVRDLLAPHIFWV